MSKYVSTRLEKIKKLNQELEEFNNQIRSYIYILKDIKEKYNFFDINYRIISDIEEDNSIKYFKNFFLQFDDNYSYNIFPRPYFEKQVPEKFQDIMDIIKKEIDIDNLNNCISESIKIYTQIRSFYYDIKLKYGTFALNADKIINYFKKMIEEQIIEQDDKYFYAYFHMKKDNKLEVIDLVFENFKPINRHAYQVKFPLQEEINKIYNQKQTKAEDRYQTYIDIFKEEFIQLNPIFCQFLNINKECIEFDFYSKYIFNIDYSDKDTYNFYINFLEQKNIDNIIEKINLEKQLNDF